MKNNCFKIYYPTAISYLLVVVGLKQIQNHWQRQIGTTTLVQIRTRK